MSPEPSFRPRVLLVDDDQVSRLIMTKTLNRAYELDLASTGTGALEKLAAMRSHIVVSDIEMPGMNGLELTRMLKQDKALEDIPVILTTAHTGRDIIRECFEAGANDYVPKPIDPKELTARVGAAVRNRQLADELAKMQRKLLHASRRAGRSEAAVGVLHNVGNALNAVNVSAKLLRQTLEFDAGEKWANVHRLLMESREQLTAALGKKTTPLLEYCSVLVKENKTARCETTSELDRLERAVEHAKQIVVNQQNLAHGSTVVAPIQITQLLLLTEELVRPSLGHASFDWESSVERFDGDECQIVQILANLVKNALEAASQVEHPRVHLACEPRADGTRVCFRVVDNGIGMTPEIMARVFESGFTSKPKGQGQGLGLHHSINAAREMGGDLTATSDGVGLGATFVLTLPAAGMAVKGS